MAARKRKKNWRRVSLTVEGVNGPGAIINLSDDDLMIGTGFGYTVADAARLMSIAEGLISLVRRVVTYEQTAHAEGLSQALVSSTLYYADGRVETVEHDITCRPPVSKECPKVVTGRTIRCFKDPAEIVDRFPLRTDP